MTPRSGATRVMLAGAFYRMSYVEWGEAGAPVVVCVHGLTRNGRDFDPLAAALADRFRVICPDLPGRGGSDWLATADLYQPPTYVQALAHLLARLDGPVMWVGTSLGGICGMALAAMPGTPLSRLVLNDIGPHIPAAGLARVRTRAKTHPSFADMAALEAHIRTAYAAFGDLTDAEWQHLARHSCRMQPDGRLALHYDPAIGAAFGDAPPTDVDTWSQWDRIKMPILAIRGAESDLLTPETLERMAARGAETHVVANAGHAPALMDAPSIAVIRAFLEAEATRP